MMRNTIKRCLAAGLTLAALLTATGCSFRSVDELYTLPKLPEDYQNLQGRIEEVTGSGAEYSAPVRGTNTQPVQLQDLDGDGMLEAIAFFKVTGDEKPLKIYIFRQTEDGYEVATVIEGEGTAISSISYEDVAGGPAKELVVSWQASGNHTLEVYSLEHEEATRLMSTGYTGYELYDIDMDNRREILVLTVDTVEGSQSRMECFDADKDGLVLSARAPMTSGVTGLDLDMSIRKSFLRGDTPIPALFVTSYWGEGIITDIFAWRNGTLENITLDGESSSSTYRVKDSAKLTDINDDSCVELPMPVSQPGGGGASPSGASAATYYAWYQYDLNGSAHQVYLTYHDFAAGWYFILPGGWESKVVVNQYSPTVGEESTVFSLWQGEEPVPFLTIYKLTGPNRHMRAKLGDRFVLETGAGDDTTIYAAELITAGWDCGLDQAAVQKQFNMIKSDWSTGL